MKKLIICISTAAALAVLTSTTRAADALDNWTVSAAGTTNHLRAATFGNGRFAAVGEAGTIVTSTDGVNWTPQRSGTESQLNGVVFGSDRFVAVGRPGPDQFAVILTSKDGVNWVPGFSGTTLSLFAVTYGNNRFVAAGGGAPGGATLLTSLDGEHWELGTWESKDKDIDPPVLTGVTYGNGRFVAVFAGEYGLTPFPWVLISEDDGREWTRQRGPEGLRAIAYGNGQFVGVGGYVLFEDKIPIGHALIFSSPTGDGLDWTKRQDIRGDMANQFTSVVFGANQFLVSGDRWTFSSVNGIQWLNLGQPIRQTTGLAFGNGQYVAVGAGGMAAKSGGQ
jgi:hypothetical protein